MTDEQIIKALENYKGFRLAPYDNYIKGDKCILVEDALDLINRQKAEIGKCHDVIFKKEELMQLLHKEHQETVDELQVKKAEIEDLREIVFTDRTEAIKNLKAEAINAYHEEVKKRCIEGGIYPAFLERVMKDVKAEMIGEQ